MPGYNLLCTEFPETFLRSSKLAKVKVIINNKFRIPDTRKVLAISSTRVRTQYLFRPSLRILWYLKHHQYRLPMLLGIYPGTCWQKTRTSKYRQYKVLTKSSTSPVSPIKKLPTNKRSISPPFPGNILGWSSSEVHTSKSTLGIRQYHQFTQLTLRKYCYDSVITQY